MEIKKFNQLFEDIGKIKEIPKPKGWVNVKIDNQLNMRMSKYVVALDNIILKEGGKSKDFYNLGKKIEILSRVKKIETDIRTKISIITILQYLNEISKNFDASSAGFLLEGFIATLIHGELKPGKTAVDVTTTYYTHGVQGVKGAKYQIKLYKKGSIKITWPEDEKDRCDYYVICLKREDRDIDVYIFSANKDDKNFIERAATVVNDDGTLVKYKNPQNKTGPYITISTNDMDIYVKPQKLRINNVDSLIEKCGEDVKNSITAIYDDISDLEYSIDTLVSGHNHNNELKNPDDAAKEANKIIGKIGTKILSLRDVVK